MARQNFRIDIPANPRELITLALKLKAQDDKLGAASPLKTIKDWAKFAPLLATADAQDALAGQLAKQAETATENRDIALGQNGPVTANTIRFFVLAGRDLLSGANKGNEHVLGDYGFVVDSSPSAASLAKKAAKKATKGTTT